MSARYGLALLFLGCAPPSAYAQFVPVQAGGQSQQNSCPGVGEVIGLDPQGDGFLSVRSGPGGNPFYEQDRVYNGQRVSICETRGPWLGAVYDSAGKDCGLNAPRSIRQSYTGPCKAGWISSRYVRLLDGGVSAPGETPSSAAMPAGGSGSCDDLWLERNRIYRDAGYCFKTTRAISTFGIDGCRFDIVQDLPLSDRQRTIVADIVRRERLMQCVP